MHLGLIGGIAPASTELYYRLLTAAQANAKARLELTIVHADLNELIGNLGAGRRGEQAEVFRELTARLKAAGAEVVAITSLAGHFCIDEFVALSPLPVVSGIEAVRAELKRRGVQSVGILGTKAVMESGLFGGLEGFEVVLPRGEQLNRVGEEYFVMARARRATDEQREFFFEAGRALQSAGAEVVLLAGTDLFLAYDGRESGVLAVDCAAVHAEVLAGLGLAS